MEKEKHPENETYLLFSHLLHIMDSSLYQQHKKKCKYLI